MNKLLAAAIRELLFNYGKLFFALLLILFADGIIAAFSIISLAPLADFILDPELKQPGKITSYLLQLGIRPELFLFSVIFVGFNILKSLMDVAIFYTTLKIKYAVLRKILTAALTKILSAKWLFVAGYRHGFVFNTVQRETMRAGLAMTQITTLISDIIRLLIYLAVPLIISFDMTIVALALALLLSAPLVLINRISFSLGRKDTRTANKMFGTIHEILSGAKIILSFARQEKSRHKFMTDLDNNLKAVKLSQTLSGAVASFYQPLGITAAVTAMFYALNRGVPLAEVAAVLWALLKALPFIGMILKGKAAINNSLPSYEQVKRLREEAQKRKEISGDKKFSALTQEIALRNVSFSYPGRSGTLDRVNIRINRGEMTALVGESGCGKSTVADIVMGLLVPDSGEVQIDGLPLSKWDIASWRHGLGYVNQDEFIFHASIKDNLLWASGQAVTEDYLWQVCKTAHADEFIRDFPQGLKTIVGERGARLSGGQRQRLALARALVNDPDILILDEATSSLDDKSEKYIQQAIERMSGKKTIIIIAHRLSTIRKADMVYVMDGGRVVEHGTYAELTTKADSRFAHMIAGQELHPGQG